MRPAETAHAHSWQVQLQHPFRDRIARLHCKSIPSLTMELRSGLPATRLRKPKSPRVPGRVLGRVPGKVGNGKSARSFSDRSFFMDVQAVTAPACSMSARTEWSVPKGKLGGRQAYATCMRSLLLAWTPESGMQGGKEATRDVPEVFSWMSARDVRSKMLVFVPGFGGPDRSFWPDVRRDIRPKTSSLG